MYRFRFLLLILVVPVVVMGLRCGSDSPTGTGDDPSGTFTVELEDYTEWHDDEAGSMYLRAEACSKASGGAMVKGLDYPGEYIEVPMTVDVGGTYEATVRYAALAGDTLKAVMVVGDCVSPLTEPGVEFVMDEGAGLG